MPEFNSNDEKLPEGLRALPPCPPLKLLLAHREDVLPGEGAAEIADHLERCGLCRALLADIEHLQPPGLSERERELMRHKIPVPLASGSRNWRWYAVSAAVAAVLLVCTFAILHSRTALPVQTVQVVKPSEPAKPKQDEPEIEVAKLAPPLELAPGLVLRGGGPGDQPSATQLAPAFDAYEKNDYPLAAERFNRLAKQFPRSDVPALYLGVTQLLMRDDQLALTSLTRAATLATGERRDAAAWYEAVAAVRAHSPNASDLLRHLCRSDRSRYARQACALEEKH